MMRTAAPGARNRDWNSLPGVVPVDIDSEKLRALPYEFFAAMEAAEEARDGQAISPAESGGTKP